MPAAEFIDRLAHRGIQLELSGGAILAHRADLLTDGIRQTIRAHRDELIAHLTSLPKPQDCMTAEVGVCACDWPHFWESPEGWRCSRCWPMPETFMGVTLTVPGGERILEES